MKRKSDGGSGAFELPSMPDKSIIGNTLMELQYDQGCRMQFAKDSTDACEWVGNITKEIAVIPEQSYARFPVNVCLANGAIRALILILAINQHVGNQRAIPGRE
jgi:hypothetical protein